MANTMAESSGATVSSSHLSLNDRSHLEISGVDEVISYDESGISLVVSGCGLTVEGEGIKMSVLDVDTGRISADGKFKNFTYDDNHVQKVGLFSGLFHKRT